MACTNGSYEWGQIGKAAAVVAAVLVLAGCGKSRPAGQKAGSGPPPSMKVLPPMMAPPMKLPAMRMPPPPPAAGAPGAPAVPATMPGNAAKGR